MISVGRRDGRKGAGLGSGAGAEMEEAELEEGEACSYQNVDDSTIDPDVALSYLDEKLQDVLGHFQKDFEGGVSAENLGAKFGGYGSFLPTYQRSPVPRTPPEVHNYNTPRSPNNLQPEGSHHNYVVPLSASLSVRHGQASASCPLARASINGSAKRDVRESKANCADESTSGCANGKSSGQSSDQRTLKVRIKVGSDNLSTKKTAEIYSGLGLDDSPASSLDGSPTDSEGFSHEPLDGPDESPATILLIMTSFAVLGNQLLSPLPDDLVDLFEKGKLQGENSNGSDSVKGNEKVLGAKRPKPFEKNACSMELKNHSDKHSQNSIDVFFKNETAMDTLACEELVANALKLPLLSNSYCNVIIPEKGIATAVDNSRVANKVKEDSLFALAEGETLGAVSTQESGLVKKPSRTAASYANDSEDKKADFHGDFLVNLRKDGCNSKGENDSASTKTYSNISKGRKPQNAEPVDHWEQKPAKKEPSKKGISHEEDIMQLDSGKEYLSPGGRKKSQGSHSHIGQGAEVPKDISKEDSSVVPKNRKSTHANNYLPENEMVDSKLQKDNGKARNRYSDFFGEIELEQEDNDADSEEVLSIDRPKDFEVGVKSTLSSNGTTKERLNGKKRDKLSLLEADPKPALIAVPITGNGSISDAAPGTSGLVNEDWVCCDKCQKWRLLPLGENPDNLPEKWLCSMLNWLPGMNRCSISQEETTKALVALYQGPANQHGHPGGSLSGLSLAEASCFDQEHQNIGFKSVASGGKKKSGIKDASAAMSQDGPPQFSYSIKKNLQESVKSRSLNFVNQTPSGNESEPMHLSKSSVVEKHRHKQKEKKQQHSDEGETRSSKIKSRRSTDQECFRISKKLKIDGTDEDWMPDHDRPMAKVGPCSSSGLSEHAFGKDRHKHDDNSSLDKNCEANNAAKGLLGNSKDKVQDISDEGPLLTKEFDDKDFVRKRKVNESPDAHIYTTSNLSGHHIHDDRRDFLEQTSENVHGKEKKARVSKSEGKETCLSKGSGRAFKKGRSTTGKQLGPDLGSTLSPRGLSATDLLRKDIGSAQPSLPATSSSSKVSGSHKNNTGRLEVKGSPVESVSSSPLRFSNPDKSISTRSLEGKDDFGHAGLFATGTARRFSDGEDDRGRNRPRPGRKDETFVTNRGSLESTVLDLQESNIGQLAGSQAKTQRLHSPEFSNRHFANGTIDVVGDGFKQQNTDQRRDEVGGDRHYHANLSHPKKSGKGSSRSKEKNGSKSELDKNKVKIYDTCHESIDHTPYGEKSRADKNRGQDKFREKSFVDMKESTNKVVNKNSKRESQPKFGRNDVSDVKGEVISSQDKKRNLPLDHDERSSKRLISDKTDRLEVSGRGKSHQLPPSGRGQHETVTHPLHLNPGAQKENGGNGLLIDALDSEEALNARKQIKRCENQNGNQLIRSKHPTINGLRIRDADTTSPVRRDSSSQAATNAVKEAKDLKHLADRLKNSGSSAESTNLYFQAALKFLYGASLLESSNGDCAKQTEIIQSMQMYSSTAKLCEFCAHEYEKRKDMAAAALAYKCMEVAYMRVIYFSHTSASRDRHELQSALQIVPSGESPSSSASDVDNLNNPTTLDKVPIAKGVNSPQIAGNHVIAARNRPSFVRLLNFAQDVNFAMEASRKSRIAFAAANPRMEEAQCREGISSVKIALDFNFQDVEGLLRLVRLAMEAISR